MNNIKPKYTQVLKEYDKPFIKGYQKDKSNLLVSINGKSKPSTVKATDKNCTIARNHMDNQVSYQILEIYPRLKTDALLDAFSSIVCLSICTVSKTIDLGINDQIQRIIHIITGALSTLGIISTIDDIAKIRNILKYNFFLTNRDELNAHALESKNMLNGLRVCATEAINKGSDSEAITYQNIDEFTLEDLKALKDNIETQQSLQFELNDPIKRTRKQRK